MSVIGIKLERIEMVLRQGILPTLGLDYYPDRPRVIGFTPVVIIEPAIYSISSSGY